MTIFAIYERATGRLIRYLLDPMGLIDDTWVAPEEGTLGVSAEVSGDGYHVSAGVLTARPANPATADTLAITANGTSKAKVSGIQSGASVRVTDQNGATEYTVTDGDIEITADDPGTVVVLVRGVFPTIDKTFTVVAT